MDLAAVMDDLGAALGAIPGLRVFGYWAKRITPPAAVVGWPDPLTYDETMRRGGDSTEMPVYVLVADVDSRSSRDQLARYADGSGTHSVKAAVEAFEASAYDTARVNRAEFATVRVAGVEYLAATFYVDITGRGAG